MYDTLLYQIFEELIEKGSEVKCIGEYFVSGISRFSERYTKTYLMCFGYREGEDFELEKTSMGDVIIFLKRKEEK